MSTTNTLKVVFSGSLFCEYRKKDIAVNPNNVIGDIRYEDFKFNWQTGSGLNQADLLHYNRYLIAEAQTLIFNLDGGIENLWGETLDYDSVKCIVIKNRATAERSGDDVYTEYDQIKVTFKDERYVIGPSGCRFISEPYGRGINAEASSESFEEGLLTVENLGGNTLSFDLIIIGSDKEETSSSGL